MWIVPPHRRKHSDGFAPDRANSEKWKMPKIRRVEPERVGVSAEAGADSPWRRRNWNGSLAYSVWCSSMIRDRDDHEEDVDHGFWKDTKEGSNQTNHYKHRSRTHQVLLCLISSLHQVLVRPCWLIILSDFNPKKPFWSFSDPDQMKSDFF